MNIFFSGFLLAILHSSAPKEEADLIIYNATIYTVDSAFSKVQAMAIRNGKIVGVGSDQSIKEKYEATSQIDAGGKFIYPGLIDAHAHFFGYGLSLQAANLNGTRSWDEIIEKVQSFARENKEGWLIGRGWDQNDWDIKEFPNKEKLDAAFPNRPVLLERVDGHASISNQAALDIAGVKAGNKIEGGEVEVKNGRLTGILIDNAIDLVGAKIPGATPSQLRKALMDAQKNCFAVGLTTIDDCGVSQKDVQFVDSLQKRGELKMRLYCMLSDSKRNFEFAATRGKIKTERLNVSSFKIYGDGALGSRGACLLQPYSDKPGWTGFLLNSREHYDSVANILYNNGFQMCTHAIGDSGNRVILNTYGKYLKGKNDRRWRIEHAQVVNKNDFKLFGQYSIIPSVQPTHATSDMYWAEARLGKDRVLGAYAYQQLLKQNGWIPLGTDFPVEDISPINTFYAAVVRKDSKGFPKNGFQMNEALSREQAIRGMTIWAAYSNFEESEKGSLEIGKFADFIMLDQDLMKVAPNDILKTKVMSTFISGEKVFERK